MHGERMCAYGSGHVCVHGESEGVYVKGVECACMGRGVECVCMGRGGCVHIEGSSVHAWGEDGALGRGDMEGVKCGCMGREGGCVHMEGVECACMGRRRVYA